MAQKRKSTSNLSSTDTYTKRARPNTFSYNDDESTPPTYKTQPAVDPTYGQRGAFPGLDDISTGDEELFYGPASDGLQYLRMVR